MPFAILNKPYPLRSGARLRVLSALAFGLFVFLFLWLYAPFGMSNVGAALPWVSLGYGLITTTVMLLLQVGLVRAWPRWYNEDTWTVGREIAQTMANIFFIAACNLLYSAWLGFYAPNAAGFLTILAFTLGVGIFPVAIQTLVRQYVEQQRYAGKSRTISDRLPALHEEHTPASAPEPLTLKDDDGEILLSVMPAHLLALEAADNYAKVYYTDQGQLRHSLIRGALNRFESQLCNGHSSFFRVHRSWLVNLDAVEKVEGNARGYTLTLAMLKQQVPVARRRLEDFEKAVK